MPCHRPTARRDDALIRRKQPNLTNHVRGLYPAFERQYGSATFIRSWLFAWRLVHICFSFQATAYDAGTNCGIFLVRPKWPNPN
ncbi:hypothetical protein N7527_006469 [Penicillium freii]|nr:hypothetical protein N7527_006469 [Penicillium freii]